MKIAIVKAQNAGLKISPICSFVIWNALLIGPATSPRIAKTIEVVTSETQLATKSLCLGMDGSLWRSPYTGTALFPNEGSGIYSWREDSVPINPRLVTTALEIPGHRAVENLGVVRGIVVRSRSIVGSLGATLQTLVGGNITLYTELCESARADAFRLLLEHAAETGANALIAVRYDANEIAPGVTEVLAYGTAVVVEATAA
jgi:uncharacterized protein YbjQ (UPF0145 family)